MATVAPNDNPIVLDTILFDLPTPDASNCYVADPYKVDRVVIYYVERDFANPNEIQYNVVTGDDPSGAAASAAEAVACSTPTDANIVEAKRLRAEANSLSTTTPFYYNEAKPVKVIGGAETYPAWLSTDPGNAFITHVTQDAEGNTLYGNFQYAWDTYGLREGDYFICWTWTPHPAGDSLSSNIKFTLGGNTVVTTSIPTHYTRPDKYYTLLERYLPDMFKMQMTGTDRTPDVLDKFNKAVAMGFTAVEDLANQIVDLQDANSTHELFLPLLASYFGLKLKTDDPTLWRRQIKQAVPLFKKKGTRKGLEEALSQAGIRMAKLTKLWQVISSHTWQESFTYDGVVESWGLAKTALALDPANFGLWLRPAGETAYISLSSDYASFGTGGGITTMTWAGSGLLVNPIDLVKGDVVRVLYSYQSVADSPSQTVENYIRSLPLGDQRDETKQAYPPKNWNVRVIEEDDPLFDVVIPDRHPYREPLVFGKIRTEFAYSENAYNNDEYNGSIRNSKLPCDIDKDFVDPCTACLGSKFNIDLEIENLSNDRIFEAQDVIREFVPFHSVLQTMNFTGGITEFVLPPVEEIEILVAVQGGDFVICGEGQMWFNRAMKGGTTTNVIDRDDLAATDIPVSGAAGTAYNDAVTIFSSDIRFDDIGMATDGSSLLEILSPSPSAGVFTISSPSRHTAVVSSAAEPLNTAAFTFRVANELTSGTSCNIYRDNVVTLKDSANPFPSVLSTFDVTHNGAGAAYKVSIPAYSGVAYVVKSVLPDGSLQLADDGSLPTTNVSAVHYTLQTDSGATVVGGTAGSLSVVARGRVMSLDASVQDIHNMVRGDCYFVAGGNQYKVVGFVSASDVAQFYIAGYSSGDFAGASLVLYQRLVDDEIGYLSHRGLKLRAATNLETSLGIQNGKNATATPVESDAFMENFLVTINGHDYFIIGIDGVTITLSGPDEYWKTLGASGTSVTFDVTHFTRRAVTIPGQQFALPPHTFRTYDRQGREVITRQTNSGPVVTPLRGPTVSEFVSQTEGIDFEIEWLDKSRDGGIIM